MRNKKRAKKCEVWYMDCKFGREYWKQDQNAFLIGLQFDYFFKLAILYYIKNWPKHISL